MIRGKDISSLMILCQNFGESIRDFIKRFVKEMIEAENVDQATTIAVLTKEVGFRGLKDSLIESRSNTWEHLISR